MVASIHWIKYLCNSVVNVILICYCYSQLLKHCQIFYIIIVSCIVNECCEGRWVRWFRVGSSGGILWNFNMDFLVYTKTGGYFLTTLVTVSFWVWALLQVTVEDRTLILTFLYTWFWLVMKKRPACHVSLDVNSYLFPELVKRRQSGWTLCVRLLKNFVRGSHRLSFEMDVRFLWIFRNPRRTSRWMAYTDAWIAVPVLVSWRGNITVDHVEWLVRRMQCIKNTSNVVRCIYSCWQQQRKITVVGTASVV